MATVCLKVMSGGAKTRGGERHPIVLKVEYQRLETFMADYTTNFSQGGTFIKTVHPLPVGTRCIFRVMLPGIGEELELLGEVMWRNTSHEYQNPSVTDTGMGISFVFESEADREHLAYVVDELVRPKLIRHSA